MNRLLDWIITPPFLILSVTTLVVYQPLLALGRALSLRCFFTLLDSGIALLILWVRLTGRRIHFEGVIPEHGALIVVSNHQSYFDIPLLLWFLRARRPRFIAKRELKRGFPSVSYVLRTTRSALVDRNDPRQALREIRTVAEITSQEQGCVVIFPEGTRARTGKLLPFRPHGLAALVEALPNATVLVVAIDGSADLFRHNLLPVPFGGVIRVTALAQFSSKEPELTKQAQSLIEQHVTKQTGVG